MVVNATPVTTTTIEPIPVVTPIYTVSHCDLQVGQACDWIFERVMAWPTIEGTTRVEWMLHPRFLDPEPHSFQLQVGRTSNPYADDWTNVGDPVVNTFFALDATKRVFGKTQWTHYRVIVTTANGSYASKPQHCLGVMDTKDWLRAKEITRLELLRLRKEAGQEGYLLKRKLFGETCSCIDASTGECRNPQCPDCFGTGITGGYYAPYPCFYVEMRNIASKSELDGGAARGTVDDMLRVPARMLNSPQIFSYDVWVDKDTDFRWVIRSIRSAVEIRGIPIVLDPVEMRLLPYSHPVYKITVI